MNSARTTHQWRSNCTPTEHEWWLVAPKNGVSNGAWTTLQMAPPKAPQTTPEMTLLEHLKTALEMALLDRLNGVAKAPEWRLKNGALTTSKWCLRTALATQFGTASKGHLECAWNSLWRVPRLASEAVLLRALNGAWTTPQMVTFECLKKSPEWRLHCIHFERRLNDAWNGAEWRLELA